MVAAYRGRDWEGALDLIETCRAAAAAAGLKLDGLYECYAARIAGYRESPPPADWAGVYTALSK